MTPKQFRLIKIAVVIGIAITVSQSIVYNNYIIPIAAMVIGSLILMQSKKAIKGVIADERDYEIAGKAALLTLQVVGWIGAVLSIVFFAIRYQNPSFELLAYAFSYGTCGLLILFGLIARFYHRIPEKGFRQWIGMGMIFLIIVLFTIFGLRFFTGEDTWICENGNWVEHGHPSAPMPTETCPSYEQ